jgi:flavin prenyltransferase
MTIGEDNAGAASGPALPPDDENMSRSRSFTGPDGRTSARPRLIVGISGASGIIYGARLLELLRPLPIETHLVMSRAAELTLALETGFKPAVLRACADVVHAIGDMAAPISSGSFKTIGMVVAPCSIRSMSEIASGVTTTLLTRAADVVLKERRRLVLLVRETPLHLGHLRTMTALSEMGAVIAPPVPAFYVKPTTIAEMIDQTLGRALDLFGIETDTVRRWGEMSKETKESC